MLIREAQPNDIEGIRSLYSQLNPEDPRVTDGRDAAALELIVAADWLFLFVGVLDERVVATCYLNVIPNLSRNVSLYGIIENVVIDQELRNKGYGKKTCGTLLTRHGNMGAIK